MNELCTAIAPAFAPLAEADYLERRASQLKEEIAVLFRSARSITLRIRENEWLSKGLAAADERNLERSRLRLKVAITVLRTIPLLPSGSGINAAILETKDKIDEARARSEAEIRTIDETERRMGRNLEREDLASSAEARALQARCSRLFAGVVKTIHPDAYYADAALWSVYQSNKELRASIADLLEDAVQAKVLGDELRLEFLKGLALVLRSELEGLAPPPSPGSPPRSPERWASEIANLEKLHAKLSTEVKTLRSDRYARVDLHDPRTHERLRSELNARVARLERRIARLLDRAEAKYGASARKALEFYLDEELEGSARWAR